MQWEAFHAWMVHDSPAHGLNLRSEACESRPACPQTDGRCWHQKCQHNEQGMQCNKETGNQESFWPCQSPGLMHDKAKVRKILQANMLPVPFSWSEDCICHSIVHWSILAAFPVIVHGVNHGKVWLDEVMDSFWTLLFKADSRKKTGHWLHCVTTDSKNSILQYE